MWDDALERGEGLVRCEGLAERLCTLGTDIIVVETASTGQITLSEGADSRNGGGAAHLSEVRALFSLRPAARCSAALASSSLYAKLRMGAKSHCQRVLTLWAGVQAVGNARQARQRAVLLEGVGKLDDARHVLAVIGESGGVQAVSRQQAKKDEHCQRVLTLGN